MHDHETIASFETADGAAAAAVHLVELGYAEREVGIEPHGYRIVDAPGLGARMAAGARRWSLAGVALGVGVALRMVLDVGEAVTVLLAGAIAGIVGGATGALAGAVQHLRHRARTIGVPTTRLEADGYGVVVTRDPAQANHALARWWDPAARPMKRRAA